MSTELSIEDYVQQQMSGDDIATNVEFLRAAGLLTAPPSQPEAVTGGNDAVAAPPSQPEAVTGSNDASADSNSTAILGLTESSESFGQ